MTLTLIAFASAASLFVGMLAFAEAGRRIAIRGLKRDPDGAKGTGSAAAAVFGLLGLIIAFTFSGAASRFEARRHLITEEGNAIGTAYLRVDLVPVAAQPPLRDLFRRYVDARIATYRAADDQTSLKAKVAAASALQNDLWRAAVAASRLPDAPNQTGMLLLPALNDMIDITTTRVMAAENHPPLVIYLLMAGLSLIGALLVGYDLAPNRERSHPHPILFAAIMSLAVYVIIDLEYPRLGLIRVDAADHLLTDVRAGMR